MTNFDETTYTISEAADKLNLSEKTLRRWEDAGRFSPSRSTGNQRRYSMEDLQILDAIKHNVIPHQKDLLTKETAAQFLGVTEATIERLVAEGKLHPFITVGTTYYPRHRLLPLLEEFKAKPPIPTTQVTPNTIGNIEAEAPQIKETPAPPKPTSYDTPLSLPPKTPNVYTSYAIQLAITIVALTLYHFVFAAPKTTPSPTPAGSVQGAATNPSLKLLDDMLDPTTGGLTATTVISKLGTTTPNLTLLPGVAPTSPLPGSLYYDASENVIKIYTLNGWATLSTLTDLQKLQFDLESKVATTSD